MASNNMCCSITSGSKHHKRTKSPAPRKKLPTNNKKKQNGKNNIKPINNKNGKTDKQNNGVYEINFNPSSTKPNPSNNIKTIPFIAKNSKPLPSKPSFNKYTSPRSPKKKLPLAQPQKVQKYHVPQNSLTASFNTNNNKKNNNNNNNNTNNIYFGYNKNKKKKKGDECDDDEYDDGAYLENIHRVKNRPAKNSIAGKLLAQQKAEELEIMLEEQEEQHLKKKAKQINTFPLAAANSFKT